MELHIYTHTTDVGIYITQYIYKTIYIYYTAGVILVFYIIQNL